MEVSISDFMRFNFCIHFIPFFLHRSSTSTPPGTSASISYDGHAIMQPESIFLFAVRGIIMFMIYALSQLPLSWQIRVDVDKVIESITMQKKDERFNAGPWPEAPVMSQFYPDSNPASEHNPSSGTRHLGIISCPSILKECDVHIAFYLATIPGAAKFNSMYYNSLFLSLLIDHVYSRSTFWSKFRRSCFYTTC